MKCETQSRVTFHGRTYVQKSLERLRSFQFSRKYGIPTHYTTAYYEDVTYRLSNNDLRVAMGSDCVVVGGDLPRGYQHPVYDVDAFTPLINLPDCAILGVGRIKAQPAVARAKWSCGRWCG